MPRSKRIFVRLLNAVLVPEAKLIDGYIKTSVEFPRFYRNLCCIRECVEYSVVPGGKTALSIDTCEFILRNVLERQIKRCFEDRSFLR